MLRRAVRAIGALLGITFILGAFALRAAPDFLPPAQMQALHAALPFLYYEKPVRSAPTRSPATPPHTGRYNAPHDVSAFQSGPAAPTLTQHKTIRVGD